LNSTIALAEPDEDVFVRAQGQDGRGPQETSRG
jgi:hypothetical protein